MSRLLNNARRLLATSTKMNWIVDSIPEESGSIGKAGGEFAKKMAAEEAVYFRKLSAEQVWSKLISSCFVKLFLKKSLTIIGT